MLKRNGYLLAVSLLTLASFLLLFSFRALDDNRLTSWQWVFEGVDVSAIFLVLFAGVLVGYIFSGASFSLRYPALFLFCFSFLAGAIFWTEPEVIVDASRYFTQAKHLEVYGFHHFFREWGGTIIPWTDLPLVPFLYGLIFRLFGEVRLYIQIFNTFLFSMTAVLTYLTGKEVWDEDSGFYGGMLLSGIPYLFIQTPLMLVDVPTMFFLMLAVFTFVKLSSGRGFGWVFLSGIAIFLAFYSKYSAWPMLSVLVLIVIVYWRTNSCGILASSSTVSTREVFYRAALSFSIAVLLIVVVFVYKLDIFLKQLEVLRSFQGPGLKKWGESFSSTFFFQVHPFITAAALYSVLVAVRKRDLRYVIVASLPILAVLLQVRRIRYTVPLFPFITLMASYGISQIRDREVRRFLVVCILLVSLTVAISAYLPFTRKMSAANLMYAGSFLDTMNGEEVKVFTSAPDGSLVNPAVAVPILDLFTKKRLFYKYEPAPPPAREERMSSPLRFTWEYLNPDYYGGSGSAQALVVISSDLGGGLPPDMEKGTAGYEVVRTFAGYEGVFQYRTLVTIYRAISKRKDKDK